MFRSLPSADAAPAELVDGKPTKSGVSFKSVNFPVSTGQSGFVPGRLCCKLPLSNGVPSASFGEVVNSSVVDAEVSASWSVELHSKMF